MSRRNFSYALLLYIASLLAFALLHRQISITDTDAIVYVTGAYSFQSGTPYPSSTWPPGYAFILSLSSDPIAFAYIVNAVSFAFATTMLFVFARRSGWSWYAALGFSIAIGFGFFRVFAQFAKPDILSFALFLLSWHLYSNGKRSGHLAAYFILGLLIPIKHIAIVFVPAGLVVDLYIQIRNRNFKWREFVLPSLLWATGFGSLLLFNFMTIGMLMSPEHQFTTLQSLATRITGFLGSIPREFISFWYGSLREPSVFIPFAVVLILGVLSILTLRLKKTERFLPLAFGLAIFGLSWLVILFRNFDTYMRLMAYGPLIAVFAFQPRIRAGVIWLLYGATIFLLAIYNVNSTNSLGINDPRYRQVAQDISANIELPQDAAVYSNASSLLAVLGKIRTLSLTETLTPDDLTTGDYLLIIDLPNYDAIMTPIIPTDLAEEAWCEVDQVSDAVLLRKCDS